MKHLLGSILAAVLCGSVALASDVPDFDAQWNFGDPVATEKVFRGLQAQVKAKGSKDDVLQLDTQLARTLGLQGRFDEAHQVLDEVEKRLDASTRTARVRYLLERGRALNSSGDKRAAVRPFAEAWKKAREWKLDVYAVDAAHMIAIVEDGDNRLAWNQRALAFAEQSSDPAARRWLGSLYNNIGWDHHDAGRYEQALVIFKKGVKEREKGGKPGRLRVARWTVARALRSLGRCEEALPMLQSLEAEWAKADSQSGYVFEELGECHLALGRAEVAGPFFKKAHTVLSEDAWFVEHEADRLQRMEKLGR